MAITFFQFWAHYDNEILRLGVIELAYNRCADSGHSRLTILLAFYQRSVLFIEGPRHK